MAWRDSLSRRLRSLLNSTDDGTSRNSGWQPPSRSGIGSAGAFMALRSAVDAAPYNEARFTKQMPATKKAARRRPFAFEFAN
ncbi:hypothetical protein ACHMW4_27740 [Mesorhizobium sp. UC22_110]|uniref:hypothetical protein n=1 Tax=Mesorhizobium sp. UC22_110 TaxID=3374552 RepID=UPI003757E22E